MARTKQVPGEKPLFWIGSTKRDLLRFPEAVKDEIGVALSVAQFGGKHPKSKTWKGAGPGVLEVVEDYRGDTYRAVYTVRFEGVVYAPRISEEVAKGDQDCAGRCRTGAATIEGGAGGL